MGAKITKRLSPGVYLLANRRIRARVTVGDRKRGLERERTFPPGTALLEVRRWRDLVRAELLRTRASVVRGTLESYVPSFPTKRRYELAAWMVRFSARNIHTITAREIRQQMEDWIDAGVAASTVCHRLSALSYLYRDTDLNPVRGIKRPRQPKYGPREVAPALLQRVLDELWCRSAKNNRGWVTLARASMLAFTGVRPVELMQLEPGLEIHLDREAPCIDFPDFKYGEPHTIPLDANGVAAAHLFIRVGAWGPYSTSSFYKSWSMACDRAQVPRFNPYRLRHSFASRLRRSGTDLADIQEMLGHKSPETTRRYATAGAEKHRGAVGRAASLWAGEVHRGGATK